MRLLILVLMTAFILSGCSRVEVYTFKKDRVDQNLSGNEGYLTGKKEDKQEVVTPGKRTLIGIDVELPSDGAEEETPGENITKPQETPGNSVVVPSQAKEPLKDKVYSAQVGSSAVVEKSPEGTETLVIDTASESEDEWIK